MNLPRSSTFNYHLFANGERSIFNQDWEADCPYSKVRLPACHYVEVAVSEAWRRYLPQALDVLSDGSTYTLASNFRRLAADNILCHKTMCGYHLARAIVFILLELNSGFRGHEYSKFGPALHALANDVVLGSPQVRADVHRYLDVMLNAAVLGGGRAVFVLVNEHDTQVRRAREKAHDRPRKGFFRR
jgi:hypothetical protein